MTNREWLEKLHPALFQHKFLPWLVENWQRIKEMDEQNWLDQEYNGFADDWH